MFDTLSAPQLLYAVVVVAAAYLVRGIAGFGSGLISIPLLALVLPLAVVVPIIGLLDYIASLTHGTRHRQAIRWHDILPLLPFTLAGVVLALHLFQTVDADRLRQALGAFIIAYATYTLLSAGPLSKGSRLWAVPAGGFGGLIGTLFGTGGPFYVIYLGLRGLDKNAFRATIAMIFILDGGARLVGYAVSGFYNWNTAMMVGAGLPLMAAGMAVGGRIHTGLTQDAFRKAIGLLLIGSGIALLLR